MKRRLHIVLILLAAAWTAACVSDDDDGAIEITGYLDGELTAWTGADGLVQVVGRDGAAEPSAPLVLDNGGATVERDASPTGSFVLGIDGASGDALSLTVSDVDGADVIGYDVVALPQFPEPDLLVAAIDPDSDAPTAIVEASFPQAIDGSLFAANPRNHAVIRLDAFSGGFVHGGRIEAVLGDILLLYRHTGAGDSASVEVEVGGAVDR